MDKENEYIEKIEEENEEMSNDDLFNITSFGADPSVRELLLQYEDGEIEIPELQRKYVWDKKKASRFIESLLLGLPVPSIFLANNDETEKRLIIDGYQRIKTLYDYISKGIWSGDDTKFRLTDSELINRRWRGKSFEDLDSADQRRLRNSTIHAIVFAQKHPSNDSGMFQIFERINTGGVSLNDQEIRNCVYQGDMNSCVMELNKNGIWRSLYGNIEDPRMKDVELVLRFLAMSDRQVYDSSEYSISLKRLMNSFMQDNVKADADFISEKKSEFINTISFIQRAFNEDVFFNYQNDLIKLRKKLYPTIFDSIMIATSIALKRHPDAQYSDLDMRREQLVKDPDYRKSISTGTMVVANIKNRVGMALKILYDIDWNEQ